MQQRRHSWNKMRPLFHLSGPQFPFPLQVSQDLPFLHPSETGVLNRLSKLGSDYIRFTEFIEQHTGHVHQQVGDPSSGSNGALRDP